LNIFKAASVEDLVVEVGEGHLTGRDVVSAVYPELKTAQQKAQAQQQADNIINLKPRQTPKKPGNATPIKGLDAGVAMHFAGCCHPLPGDRIVGIVTTGKGVTIHTIDCESLEQFADTPERWLDLAWNVEPEDKDVHLGRIDVIMANEPNSLGNITTVIAKNLGNITNLKFTNRNPDFFEMIIDVEVRDVKHLTNIIAALRASPAINSVERARS